MLPIDPVLFGSFLLATALLVSSPGPVLGLIIARTLGDGRLHGLMAALGAASAASCFLALALGGFVGLEKLDPEIFDAIRYAGAAYILWMALQAWRAEPDDIAIDQRHKAASLFADYRKAFVLCSLSPKTILFFGAFFPLFVTPALPRLPQLWLMAIGFLVVSLSLDCMWIMLAGWARQHLLKKNARQTLNRISAGALGLGATLLVFAA